MYYYCFNTKICLTSFTARSTFVAVDRGGCKFTEKAVLAALAGYNGVIILDNKNNTGVRKISGDHVSRLDRIPVLFLLKKEAEIFRSLLKENPNMKIMIEGEHFSEMI